MAPRTTSRALCDRCLESVEAESLEEREGQRLCPGCIQYGARHRKPTDLPPETEYCARHVSPGTSPSPAAFVSPPGPPAAPSSRWRRFHRDASQWARGRHALIRAPLWLYLAYAFVRHVLDPMYGSLLDPLNLGIHELGHFVFRPFGEFLHAAGGTILQCLVPVVGIVIFRRQRDFFGIAVAGAWLATNLFDVATYVGDARARQLPLVTPGGGLAKHDWSYLLGELGILSWDTTLEGILRVLATVVMAASLAFGAWLLERMLRTSSLRERGDGDPLAGL
jgi:hypothetical protein